MPTLMKAVVVVLVFVLVGNVSNCSPDYRRQCIRSVTTASGTRAPHFICSGDLIFQDEFDYLDLHKWQHEITLSGGGNWEFQLYGNNRTNSFVKDGKLYIKPTLTSDQYDESFLYSGTISLYSGAPADQCTNPSYWGCERKGTRTHVLNPIKSARIRTATSFSFKYGRMEVRAKMPAGDWLWPAIWLLPRYSEYGTWPASGEIDIVEARGNRKLILNGLNIGTELASSTMHFGPYPPLNGYRKAHFEKRAAPGFDQDYHNYQMEWTPEYVKFSIDNEEMGRVVPPEGGFWELGKFSQVGENIDNPWHQGSRMAPFDKEFYIVMNLAVGGVNGFFPDNAENPGGKPWLSSSSQAATDFWQGKDQWLPTWNLDVNKGESSSLQVDYIRVWAL